MTPEALRIDRLETENAALRLQVTELRRALTDPLAEIPSEWRLTRQESRIFSMLLHRERVSRDAIMAMLYSDRLDVEMPNPRLLDVFIWKLRRKLRPFDVDILTSWGFGWSLPPQTRARLLGARS